MADFQDSPYAQAALGLSVVVVIAFGVYAFAYAKFNKIKAVETNEEFVTARGTSSMWYVAWSFYASAIGSWVISGPADYAFWSGIVGCAMYAFAAGLPILLVAFLGDSIQTQFPTVLSLSDFVNQRFGLCSQILVVSITLFNMAIATCAEYTTIASLFHTYVGIGSYDIIMPILLAVVTLTYTGYGGLRVSILTDKVQAVTTLLLVSTLTIYISITFRPEGGWFNPSAVDESLRQQLLGTTKLGYSSIFTMPLSLITATVFSEAMWQRVWASESRAALRGGATIAACMVFVVVFLVGFTGILGGWSGNAGYDTDPNLRIFQVLNPEQDKTIVSSAIGVVVIVLAVTMSESALDSLENGIGASFNGAVARHISDRRALLASRLIVIVLNIPLVLVGSFKLKVMGLFLASNMVCTCAAFPVVLGLVQRPFLKRYHSDIGPPLSFLLSILLLVTYATTQVYDSSKTNGENISNGFTMAFYDNGYAWDYFAVAAGSSIGSTIVLIVLQYIISLCTGSTEKRSLPVNSSDSSDKHASII
mmetsp:Transcript_18999/g.31074  ORF Transcript_18999/g.31074 Transcript_18999/m.31074 type:complete len:534 (+) Transcript_18999:429-2030(+)|eukprot:CAMPEP_0203760878 /NCGR_PEP_ID=MMETSP0098-20131031/14072_1 /ASSEMBLY_ACC=CAM_ASM_000208 /TAXON_ID=96639 /ORGANISM=" , Strain NY0313808BC1" /LENGTH=533 /DNA_ID=CAMNT_0050654629 /DNA_START=216 /DNA_END=1817 /DNA_ORIENTATION=-